jgi:hypothetical protein
VSISPLPVLPSLTTLSPFEYFRFLSFRKGFKPCLWYSASAMHAWTCIIIIVCFDTVRTQNAGMRLTKSCWNYYDMSALCRYRCGPLLTPTLRIYAQSLNLPRVPVLLPLHTSRLLHQESSIECCLTLTAATRKTGRPKFRVLSRFGTEGRQNPSHGAESPAHGTSGPRVWTAGLICSPSSLFLHVMAFVGL